MPDEVVTDQSHEVWPCDHCGGYERTVWGWVKRDRAAHAVYYARWRIGHREQGIALLLSIGGWGKDEDEKARVAIAFRGLVPEGKREPALELIDAASLAWSERSFLGAKLTMDEALARPDVLADARAMAMLVVREDERARAFITRAGRDPRRAADLVADALAQLNASDDVGAEVTSTHAIGFDPEQWEAYFMRGWARVRAEQPDGAIPDLETYLARSPGGKNAARARKVLEVARKKVQGRA